MGVFVVRTAERYAAGRLLSQETALAKSSATIRSTAGKPAHRLD
jgi:hypothetical protein